MTKAKRHVILSMVCATPNALNSLEHETMFNALKRHMDGDWGDCRQEDWDENELSLREGYRLFSVYRSGKGLKFWITTEADRPLTTILMPEDYQPESNGLH